MHYLQQTHKFHTLNVDLQQLQVDSPAEMTNTRLVDEENEVMPPVPSEDTVAMTWNLLATGSTVVPQAAVIPVVATGTETVGDVKIVPVHAAPGASTPVHSCSFTIVFPINKFVPVSANVMAPPALTEAAAVEVTVGSVGVGPADGKMGVSTPQCCYTRLHQIKSGYTPVVKT